jgi:hypothetical protein
VFPPVLYHHRTSPVGFIVNGDNFQAIVYFDNITIRPVPEPGALAVIALGALGPLRRCCD